MTAVTADLGSSNRPVEQDSLGRSRSHSAHPLELSRVLLDSRKIADGGIGTYLRNLVRGFGDEVNLLGDPSEVARACPWRADSGRPIISDFTRPFSLSEMFGLARRVDPDRFDLFHTPHYALPFWLRCARVVTIHDLIHLSHPEHWYHRVIGGFLIRSALQRADRVITVSRASAAAISTLVGAELAAKVRVIPNAIDPVFFQPVAAGAAQKLGIVGPYVVLVLSNNKPHKGSREALEAFRRLRLEFPTVELVVVGRGGLDLDAAQHEAGGGVKVVGMIDTALLPSLYAGARAALVASRIEGFCLPVLEAHSVGTPVVMTPDPATCELQEFGDVVAADFTGEALYEALRALLLAPRRVSLADPRRFACERIVQQTVQVYDEAFSVHQERQRAVCG